MQVRDRRPTDNDGLIRGYTVGAEWCVDGTVYRCRQSAPNAVWVRAPGDPMAFGGALPSRLPLPGDAVAGVVPSIAIGMHLLRQDYAGDAFRIGRDSDDATLQLKFLASGEVDWLPLRRFIRGTKGRLLIAYNQGSGDDVVWTGTDAPVISQVPEIGGWHSIVFENAAPYNSDYTPREGLALPSSLTGTTDNHAVLVCGAFAHSSNNVPLIEFDIEDVQGGLAFFKRSSSSFQGLRLLHHTTAADGGTYQPHLGGAVVGYSSAPTGVTIYSSDRRTMDRSALTSETFAGGRIGLTTSASFVGSSRREGDVAMGAVLVFPRALTSSEYLAARASLISYAELRPQTRINLICNGDSITRGAGASYYDTLPRRIARLLSAPVTVYNFGTSGGQTSSQNGSFAAADANAYDPYAPLNLFYLSIGTNDLGNGAAAPNTYEGIRTYVNAAKALGPNVLVVIGSVRPRANFQSGALADEKDALVALLTAGWKSDLGADGYVDYNLQPVLGERAAALNTAYYLDGTHQTDLARQLESAWVAPQLDAVLAAHGFL